MTEGAASERSTPLTPQRRLWLFGSVAVLIWVLAFLPPLSHLARRYELGLILRYGLWALVVPPLVVLAAPWRNAASATALAEERARHPEFLRAVGFVLLDGLVMVWWFTPTAARVTDGHPWFTAAESLTLVAAGIGLWLELVESVPLVPRLGRLPRVVLGAVAMWLVWIEAYLVGMSQSDWYGNFRHVAGHGLSGAADQQVAAVVLWFIATVAFVPVIFLNAMRWLQSEQDPDDELRRLLREERRLGDARPEGSL